MEIEIIRERVRDGKHLVKSHAIIHALKEGFERRHIVEAVLEGKIIEEYPDDKRLLICGKTSYIENFANLSAHCLRVCRCGLC